MAKANSTVVTINPMIGSTPSETIENVVGALQWLNALDCKVSEAFGGEPIDSITFGRDLLGQCCINALIATEHELKKGAAKPAPADASKSEFKSKRSLKGVRND